MSTIWQPNTPATVDENLNVSAPKINSNFNTIGNAFGQDHNPLGSTTNVGQHNQSTYIPQSAVPTQDPNNIRLFSQIIDNIPQILAQFPILATSPSTPLVASELIQLTNSCSPTIFQTGVYRQVEVSLIINGIILKIGSVVIPSTGSSSRTVTFGADNQASPPTVRPPANPFPNNIFFCPVMSAGFQTGLSFSGTGTLTTAGFSLTTSLTFGFCYIAAGN